MLSLLAGVCCGAFAGPELPDASPGNLPRWRGFNLLEKFYFSGRHEAFREDDFRMISEWGFNFVRLPIDYRGYIVDGDWERFDEAALEQIDQAVGWGAKHGIHVCINLHRAPGWTVAKPPEKTSLWTDPEPRRVAAKHWGMFARRYKGVPGARLSFNLFNEPPETETGTEQYVEVVEAMLKAIRAEDPERLVLCDGIGWGRKPVAEFIPMKVGMMTRGYDPFPLTHFKARWVHGSDRWPVPRWPDTGGTNGALLGPAKGKISRPVVIAGEVAAGSTLRLVMSAVSSRATVVVTADGAEIWRKEIVAERDDARWEKVVHEARWNSWRAEGAVVFKIPVVTAAKRLELRTVAGDWCALSEIGIAAPDGSEAVVGMENKWDQEQEMLSYRADAAGGALLGIPRDREWLRGETIAPWIEFTDKGGSVMVGEWGAFRETPHDVVLRWAEDCLRNWQDAEWGWALWNFRGTFGVLDSQREDVDYEDFQGHQLDRKMLELLRRY